MFKIILRLFGALVSKCPETLKHLAVERKGLMVLVLWVTCSTNMGYHLGHPAHWLSRNIFANFCVTYCWRQAERQGPFTSLFFVLGHCQVFGDSIFVRKMPYTSGIFFSVLIHSYIRWSQNLVSWPHVPFCFLLGHMYHYGMCYILHNCYSIALSYGIDKTETLYAHKHTVLEQKNTQIHKYKNRKTQKDKCKMFGRWM